MVFWGYASLTDVEIPKCCRLDQCGSRPLALRVSGIPMNNMRLLKRLDNRLCEDRVFKKATHISDNAVVRQFVRAYRLDGAP